MSQHEQYQDCGIQLPLLFNGEIIDWYQQLDNTDILCSIYFGFGLFIHIVSARETKEICIIKNEPDFPQKSPERSLKTAWNLSALHSAVFEDVVSTNIGHSQR